MKQQIKIWGTRIFSLVLIAAAVQYWGMPLYKQYFTPKKTEVYIPTTKVKEGRFTVSFQQIGTLDAENSVVVTSEINGKIISIVGEGKFVSAGAQLAVFDTTELDRELKNQTLEYENQLANVDRAKAELTLLQKQNETDMAQQKAQLDFDKNELTLAQEDLEKKKRLLTEKLVTGEQVRQAEGTVRSRELTVQKGEGQYALKDKEVKSKESQKNAEIKNIEFRSNMAKSQLEQAKSRMKGTTLTAPASGLVVLARTWDGGAGRRAIKEGDSVHPEQRICTLPDLSSMMVNIQVGEADAPRVRLEMPVRVKLEAVPDKTFHGTVKDISSLATEVDPWEGGTPGQKNFAVTIALKESNPKILKPGMTANAEFICDEVAKTVFIPIECVVEKDGKTYVFVKEGGKYKRTLVKTSKYNDNFIVITKGLKKNQVVALRDPTRDLDLQESGSAAPGTPKEKEKKEAVPIPEPSKKNPK